MLIPYQDLSTEALHGLAKDYVISKLNETEFDFDLQSWIDKTLTMIKNGELLIEFSEANQSVYLKTQEEIDNLSQAKTE